jgi:hypothetical protein
MRASVSEVPSCSGSSGGEGCLDGTADLLDLLGVPFEETLSLCPLGVHELTVNRYLEVAVLKT